MSARHSSSGITDRQRLLADLDGSVAPAIGRVNALTHERTAVLLDITAVVIDLIGVAVIGIIIVIAVRHVAAAGDKGVPAETRMEAGMKTAHKMRSAVERGNAAHRGPMECGNAAMESPESTAA